jgi:hypothetical protein
MSLMSVNVFMLKCISEQIEAAYWTAQHVRSLMQTVTFRECYLLKVNSRN